MKLTLQMEDELDAEGAHEHLALLYNLALAKIVLAAGGWPDRDKSDAWAVMEEVVFAHAMMLDQGEMVVNGKTYRPRIAFVDKDGKLLPGAEEFDYLHEYATVFEDDLEESDEFSIVL